MSKEHKTKDEAVEKIMDAGRHIKSIQQDLTARLDEMKARVDELTERTQEHISDQPLLVLGTVFMLGLVLGFVLSEAKS